MPPRITPELYQGCVTLIEQGFSIVPCMVNKEGKKTFPISAWNPLKEEALSVDDFTTLINGGHIYRDGKDIFLRDENYNTNIDITLVAIICGGISGGIEAVDVDLKNDYVVKVEGGKSAVWDELWTAIKYNEILEPIHKELIIEQTMSGGYHIIYRTPDITPNCDLALLPYPVPDDQQKQKIETLIELIGDRGALIVTPSNGYNEVQNKLTDDIPLLTNVERAELLRVCRTFDKSAQTTNLTKPSKPQYYIADTFNPDGTRATEIDDYNKRATPDSLSELLQEYGWTQKTKRGNIIRMLRPQIPGTKTESKDSGQISPPGTKYENGTMELSITMFRNFSSSAHPFKRDKTYSPFQVYMILAHDDDYNKAKEALKGMGFGAETFQNIPDNLSREIIITDNEQTYNELKSRGKKVVKSIGPINKPQIEHLTAKGVKNFILCLEDITDIYGALSPIIAARGCAYISQAATEQAISEAKPYFRYFLDNLLDKYPLSGPQADQNVTLLTDELVKFAGKIPDPIDREKLIGEALPILSPYGITKSTIEQVTQDIRKQENKKAQTETLSRGLTEAQGLLEAGSPEKALEKFDKLTRTLRLQAAETNVEALLSIDTEDSISEVLKRRKDDLQTGYRVFFDDRDTNGGTSYRKPEPLRLPSGALTIIAARTSHRKTGLMLNMALNIAEQSHTEVPGSVYFLTYEEDSADLLMKLLNIYINEDLDTNNLDYITSHFRKGDTRNNKTFNEKKDKFFSKLISTGRLKVKGLDGTFTSTSLASVIDNLMKIANPSPSVVFIDYIQLIGTDKDIENRQVKLQQVCTELRELAKRANIPVVLGAQFNRNVKQEGDIDSVNIREAGDIEQEANLVLGLWDRAFTKEAKTETKNGKPTTTSGHIDRNGNPARKEPGVLYVEVLKGRNIGTGGYAELSYNPKSGKIVPKPRGDEDEESTPNNSNKTRNFRN
jgi:hypothetical protein